MLKNNKIDVVKNSFSSADITHIHTVGPWGLFKLLTSPHTVVSAHIIPESFKGSLIGEQYWNRFSTKYLRYFYNQADLVLAVAPHVKDVLVKMGVTSRIEVLPNGIDTSHFKKDAQLAKDGREILSYSESEFIVMGVGQIQSRKGIQDFIKIARKCPDYKFVWVGSAPFKFLLYKGKELENQLKDLPSNMRFEKNFSYGQMTRVYNGADVFLFPSYQENAPMAVIEAAATGLPLLLRDIPEYKALYEKNYLSATTNEEFIKILKKLATDKTFYNKTCDQSIILSKKYSFSSLFLSLLKLYNSIL